MLFYLLKIFFIQSQKKKCSGTDPAAGSDAACVSTTAFTVAASEAAATLACGNERKCGCNTKWAPGEVAGKLASVVGRALGLRAEVREFELL